jgi:hypothetical protein
MNATRAMADQLERFVLTFTGSSGGGQWRFQLPCKYCEDMGTVSASRHNIGSPVAKRKAAEAFQQQGWWIDDRPICPKCYLRKCDKRHAHESETSP